LPYDGNFDEIIEHPSLLLPWPGGRFDAQTRPRPGAAEAPGASLPGRIREFPGRCVRDRATHHTSSPEARPRSGRTWHDPGLSRPQAPGPCLPAGHPAGRPCPATRSPDLGRRVDPRDARRRQASGLLAQLVNDPALVPGRRVGPSSGRAATGSLHHSGRPAPSDLADRCLRTDRARREDRGLLASDPGRGDRGRLEDGRLPPSASGPRSTRVPPRPPCGGRSSGGGCPSG
jgi:hypothetical protein